MDERNEFITYLCKGINSKDSMISRQFKTMTEDMYKKKYISKKERFVIFNPPTLITKLEIKNAVHHINQEMEAEVEKYFQQRINGNENDYIL